MPSSGGSPAGAEVDLVAIHAAASRVRRALEHPTRPRHVLLDAFPAGSCSAASVLLGQYLLDEGLGNWIYRAAKRSGVGGGTHAWLELDGWILDITCDQFEERHKPVSLTRDASWHAQFDVLVAREPTRLQTWDNLKAVYPRLRALMASLPSE